MIRPTWAHVKLDEGLRNLATAFDEQANHHTEPLATDCRIAAAQTRLAHTLWVRKAFDDDTARAWIEAGSAYLDRVAQTNPASRATRHRPTDERHRP